MGCFSVLGITRLIHKDTFDSLKLTEKILFSFIEKLSESLNLSDSLQPMY